MPNISLTKCPYCNKKISFVGAYFLKSKGEYCCEKCKCISNVVINRAIYAPASITCVLSLLILVLYSFFGDSGNFIGVILVLLPFLLFYCFVPFFVKLEPCKDKSYESKIIEKKQTIISDEAYQNSLINTQGIELNVSEDFSKNFSKTKSIIKEKNKSESENNQQI